MDELIGVIKMFAGYRLPGGYAFCDGASVNITDNQVLFSIIGTTYGGDGIRTYNLPDLRDTDPQDGARSWDPEKPRWIICVAGRYPNFN